MNTPIEKELSNYPGYFIYRKPISSGANYAIIKTTEKTSGNYEIIANFKKEYQLLNSFGNHEHYHLIPKTVDLIENEEQITIIFQDIGDCVTLEQYLEINSNINIKLALKLSIHIADVLNFIHEHHIIHKNINPKNIIISLTEPDKKSILINFDIAISDLEEEKFEFNNKKEIEGNFQYISPEQTLRINKKVDYHTDFYSLGMTLYKIFTNKLPFTAENPLEWVYNHIAKEPKDPRTFRPDIPEMVSKIILKLIAKNPEDRYNSTKGIKSDLEQALLSVENNAPIKNFQPGLADSITKFNISDKLYGRENELEKLIAVCKKSKNLGTTIAIVTGQSGIGKTNLIMEVGALITKEKGFIALGKFDKFKKNIQLSALIDAINRLMEQIVYEISDLEEYKTKLNIFLDGKIYIMKKIITIIDNLGLVDKNPKIEIPNEKLREFIESTLIDLLKFVSTPDRAVIMFIDDLQWGDEASFLMLKKISESEELKNFSLILSYRDEEATVHLKQFIDSISNNATLEKIHLLPLKVADIKELIFDNFKITDQAFIDAIYKKTQGIPFAVKTLLKILHKEKLFYFSFEENKWVFKLNEIDNIGVSENIAKFIISKIQEIELEFLKILQIAACIGMQFNLKALLDISGNEHDVLAAINTALQFQIIIPLNSNYKYISIDKINVDPEKVIYKFSHDMVYGNIISEITDEESQEIHLQIAEYYYNNQSKINILNIADHYIEGLDSIKEEKILVKALNIIYLAAQRAQEVSEFSEAINYYKILETYLNSDFSNYQLKFNHYSVFLNLGHCYCIIAEHKKSEEYLDKAEAAADTDEEIIDVILEKVSLFTFSEKYVELIQVSIRASKLLGIKIKENYSIFHILFTILKIELLLLKYPQEELLKITNFEDKQLYYISKIYYYIATPDQIYNLKNGLGRMIDVLYFFIKERKMNNFILASFTRYILLTRIPLLLYNNALFYVNKIKDNIKDLPFSNETGQMCFYTGLTSEFLVPFNELILTYQRAAFILKSCFNYVEAYQAHSRATHISLTKGESLAEFKEHINELNVIRNHMNHLEVNLFFAVCDGMYKRLTKEDPSRSSVYPIQEFLSNPEVLPHPAQKMAFASYAVFSTFLTAEQELFEKTVLAMWDVAQNPINNIFVMTFDYYFFAGLYFLENPEGNAKKIKTCLKFMGQRSNKSPNNFMAKYLFLKNAHELQTNKNKDIAIFSEAINYAKKSKNFQMQAIIFEYIGKYFYKNQNLEYARMFFENAIVNYSQYGATYNVDLLASTYKNIIRYNITDVKKQIGSELDLITVIKLDNFISKNIDFQQLLENFLIVSSENIGANRAVFISNDIIYNKLKVICEFNLNENKVLHLNTDLTLYKNIAQNIVFKVYNDKATIIIDDASTNELTMLEKYVTSSKVLSIVCMPIFNKNTLKGIIYYENYKLKSAFSNRDIKLLEHLNIQVGISIENAELYLSTSRFVPSKYLNLLNKSILDVRLGDILETKMGVLFADIRNFTKLSEQIGAKKTFELLNTFFSYIEPVVLRHGGIIDKFIGDAVLVLFQENIDQALNCALDMIKACESFNKEFSAKNNVQSISIGIGVHTGELMLGILGGTNRMDVSVISDTVNTASRIEELTKTYKKEILLSDSVYQAADKNKFNMLFVDEIQLRGKVNKIKIWELRSNSQTQS